MSSYIDHYRKSGGLPNRDGSHIIHSWDAFTKARLEWLYGPDQQAARAVQTQSDLSAWRNLGRRAAA